MDEPTYTCAAWYIDDYGAANYELAETEQEAAEYAAWADGDGTALGLQRADGTTVPAAKWQAFAEEKRKLLQADQDRRNTQRRPFRPAAPRTRSRAE